jgi:hypothetical protein
VSFPQGRFKKGFFVFERDLRKYFEGQLKASDLKTVIERMLNDEEFEDRDNSFGSEMELTSDHLIKVCDDILAGHLPPAYAEHIGDELTTSDQFVFEDSQDGERAQETAFDWDECDEVYRLTLETIQKFKARLLTGEDLFTDDDLFAKD